jgi:hypothetical protein
MSTVPEETNVPATVNGSPLEPVCWSFSNAIKLRTALFKLAGEQPSAILILVISVLSAAVVLNSEILVFAIFYPCLNHISLPGEISVQVSVPAVIVDHVSEEGDIADHVSVPADTGVHVSVPGVTGVHPSPCLVPLAVTVPTPST